MNNRGLDQALESGGSSRRRPPRLVALAKREARGTSALNPEDEREMTERLRDLAT
jgi:hypothetical protein